MSSYEKYQRTESSQWREKQSTCILWLEKLYRQNNVRITVLSNAWTKIYWKACSVEKATSLSNSLYIPHVVALPFIVLIFSLKLISHQGICCLLLMAARLLVLIFFLTSVYDRVHKWSIKHCKWRRLQGRKSIKMCLQRTNFSSLWLKASVTTAKVSVSFSPSKTSSLSRNTETMKSPEALRIWNLHSMCVMARSTLAGNIIHR